MLGLRSHKPTVINWRSLAGGISQSKDGRFRIVPLGDAAEKMYQLIEIGLTHDTNLGNYRTVQLAADAAKDYA